MRVVRAAASATTSSLAIGVLAAICVCCGLLWIAARPEHLLTGTRTLVLDQAGRKQAERALMPPLRAHELRPQFLPKNVANFSVATVSDGERALIEAIPQFLIVGVQKCGTSALYFSLCLHPSITCSAYVKEPFFLSLPSSTAFLKDYAALSMYTLREQYHHAYVRTVFDLSQMQPNTITMEASTTYFESSTAFEIASNHLLNANKIKFLVILREPVTRAYSHYQHHMRKHGPKKGQPLNPGNVYHGEKYRTFTSAVAEELAIIRHCRHLDEMRVRDNLAEAEGYAYEAFYTCVDDSAEAFRLNHKRALPGYLLKGLYHGRLHQWLKRFPGRVKVIIFDRFRKSPMDELASIQSFLGLPYFDYSTVKEEIMHEYQEGSRYEHVGGPEIQEICEEFAVHNDLLSHALGLELSWNEKLRKASFVIPLDV